ncbi:unnamed protein product [Phaedon cochleariae]|uniref:HTH OST-type domain-containing protein n=1 Tax=Phaedon cochleariae TaxID=80249 RepID=A0A9P0DLI2_PHACE|nr:unnamed protein product [Phaedon cochleariae]
MNFCESEEMKIAKILISIINVSGNGLPLDKLDSEFINYCGFPIPYKKFGAESLKSWVLTLPDIYLVKDCRNNDILIQQSMKSTHIKDLIMKQKRFTFKRKVEGQRYQNMHNNKRQKKFEHNNLPQGSFIHSSTNSVEINGYDRFELFQKLECMLPLFYKHQALGDDFFLDIADTKLGYYVSENGPKECGLCISGQTIAGLTEKVRASVHLAPRVVVMIGFRDLLQNRNVNSMIYDLRQLINELKKKNTRVTLVTLIPSPKLPDMAKLRIRMDIFNKAILDYSCDSELCCNVIDMNAIFQREAESFRREYDRFMKVAKNDNYKVFSDYGRKIFLSTLKSCLKEQLEAGH